MIKTPTKLFLIREYILKNLSAYKIADQLGCTNGAIYYYLKKYNIKTRSHSLSAKKYPRNYCIDCNKEITFKANRCSKCCNSGKNNPMYGKINKHNQETKCKMSKSKGGTGIPYENNKYSSKFYSIRKFIRNRDNNVCQGKDCNITEKEHKLLYNKVLDIHHIDYNKQNCSEENLITLCHKCNMKVNKNRDYWKNYFTVVVSV